MRLSFSLAATALAAVAFGFDCSGPYFSFYNRGGPAMSYQRLDPALYPGTESPHLHSFDGGNGLVAELTYADTQGSTCTTTPFKQDKSLYWRPTLFWNGNNTGFYRVPEMYSKIYYKFGDNNVRYNVSAFPDGFMMIAGNAMLRHNDSTTNMQGPQIYWRAKSTEKGDVDGMGGFPSGFKTAQALTAEIHFPTCWNGQPINPAQPSAHMAYANGTGTDLEKCPPGFQVARFPEIFIEFWFSADVFDNTYSASSIPWVLANGDPTGYGFHADFANGWEEGVLSKAVGPNYLNCGCGCGTSEYTDFFGSQNVYTGSEPEFKNCAPLHVEYPGDDVTPMQSLPGCNPLQSGPADATAVTGPSCSAAAATPMSTSSAGSTTASAATSASTAKSSQVSAAAVAASSTTSSSASGTTTHTALATATATSTVVVPGRHRRASHWRGA